MRYRSEDNEVIKALMHCQYLNCIECGRIDNARNASECLRKIIGETLDLINCQQADIEKKDIEIDILIRKKEALKDEVSELRAEVERLRASIKEADKCFSEGELASGMACVIRLAKEMVGDDND